MVVIKLNTTVDAPIEVVFDLSRNIDMHQYSVSNTQEKAVSGVTFGLINQGESVTWRAKHFGIFQQLTVEIVAMERPVMFIDRMTKGIFKSMDHQHHFEKIGESTIMHDLFCFQAPFGMLGIFAEKLFLARYMKKFLKQRNTIIKQVAESGQWKNFLS
ncbi:SRPBCC family protein [Sphingobacterium sp. LRF_L2]|uniref:SRPBCC family protein n=1 Tax=Sphingobacterium sp. LRF_L2 TaxID=3369421 RepID=UPI003F5F255C